MTTLRQLRFLVALDDTLNFSRASEQCNVTQSTLSTGLKELEARLGIQIAERTKHSVLMTPVGHELAERARTILAQVQDLESRADQESSVGVSAIRLGTIPTVGPFLMPRAMPLLRKLLPATKLYLREELTEPLIDGLMEGRLDLLLIALPHKLPAQIETLTLFSDGYSLVTPVDHPLGNRNTVGADDLTGRHLLLLEKGHCLQRHALSSLPEVNLEEDETFAATSLSTLVAMVEEDLGITLLPKLAVNAGISKGHKLHLSDVRGACPREVVLAWRRSASNVDLYKQIGACLTAANDELKKAATPNDAGGSLAD